MKINLFDDASWLALRPLTFTRPVADLRIGILTIAQKWERHLNAEAGYVTMPYLAAKYPGWSEASLFINGAICPDPQLMDAVMALADGEVLIAGKRIIAYRAAAGVQQLEDLQQQFVNKTYEASFIQLRYPEDIFSFNDAELRKDFALLTAGRSSQPLSSTNIALGDQFFLEEGASVECSTLNSLQGPIYIGKDSQVWEGCHIRGSFALCDNSQIKMGAKIYGQTTIGPYCRVGGEINNAVIWGYSSKGHEGYLGNAVLGQWCNIGADSNNSNLKNNYAEVKIWDYESERFRKTGLQFCGLIMADHAKCGINTMFNTGTIAGVGANIFGAGFPRNFIPDFSWGGAQGLDVYALNKMFDTTEKVFERRSIPFDQVEKDILKEVFELTQQHRRF